jgi:hypothetical protein
MAAGLAVHPVLALHDVPRAVPEVLDAAEVAAEAARWAVDVMAAGEVVAPRIAVHRARNTGWFWLRGRGRLWLGLRGGSGLRMRGRGWLRRRR